jgi:DNA ligase 1
MPCYKIVDELSLTSSKLAKEAIVLREAEAGNTEFFDGFCMAYDPMISFGVKIIPEKITPNQTGSFTFVDFCELARKLSQRELTGKAAQEALADAMDRSTVADWNGWYRRILIKDMRCGATEGTINRVTAKKFPQFAIPLFECQLAHDGANHESKVTGNKLIEVKLDGVRMLTIVYPDGRVDQFSRNGKELVNFPHIKEQFAGIAGSLSTPIVFDGEVMSSSFQDLMKQVHRKSDVAANDAVLYLFDWLPLEDFKRGKSEVAQINRSSMLKGFIDGADLPNIRTLGYEAVNLNTKEGAARFKEINAKAIADGYEGIMIKDPAAHYECKRSVAWLKQKPFIEVTLEIKDFEEGTGKNAGRLGALVCEGVDDGKAIRVNVGSGFSDDSRSEYWNGRTGLLGNLVEVRADAVTQNQDGTYSLRFPRFKGFRGFEPREKI